ncbi:MAG: primosomal protein N' [Pseudomonadota bacterium]
MTGPSIAKIAVNVPLSREFDYRIDGSPPAVGSRVRVPFGRREPVGVVLSTANSSKFDIKKLKSLIDVLDDDALLSDDDLWLLRFCSDYYHHPIGEVVAAALPAPLRQGRPLQERVEHFRACVAAGERLRRAPKQQALYDKLAAAGDDGVSATALNTTEDHWRPAARALIERGLVERFDAITSNRQPTLNPQAGPELNTDQQRAVDAVGSGQGFGCFVLDGVTGSGKTEVYLQLIESTLQRGEQVLVLVPEIGLTPQLVSRFEHRLGFRPALLHSALTDNERLDAWRRAREGSAPLVVGTRSAVFVPLDNPGLIIVDEEHDPSLKQQEGLRYSARDLAIARAKRAAVPVVLGSATPSLELLWQCQQGRYTRLPLPVRAGGAKPPRIRLLDTTRDPGVDGLSNALLDAVARHLDDDGQALLFLNRRGFAPTLICGDCGHVAECHRCDARMTVHQRQQQLRCHHCGASRPIDPSCSDCGSNALRPLGEGTERLEDALKIRFPQTVIKRIDSDSVQRKGAIGEALEAAIGGDADILVGTQMLSKGHHFPKLTLVGIVNADQGLFGTDFRSGERMAQSIVQVAGRAGREQRAGEVLVQTAFPEHAFWQRLIEGGYAGIAGDELTVREQLHWPPYSRLALLRASAHRREDALRFLERARQRFARFKGLTVLGPVDAPMARRAGRHRVQLLLQSSDRALLHHALAHSRRALEDLPEARRVRWSVDVDPIELL